MKYYLPLADRAYVLDNSFKQNQTVIAYKKTGFLLEVVTKPIWKTMEKAADA